MWINILKTNKKTISGHWFDLISINIYFLGLTTLSQTMTPLIIPLLIQQFVGLENQNTYYGIIRLWTLMVALIVQAFMGIISDRTESRYGRRRPFIFWGTNLIVLIIIATGVVTSFSGLTGYWTLFTLMIIMMIAANTAQAAAQGLIPDLIPEDKRGYHSGIKSLFEVPIPLIIVALFIGPAIARGQYWLALGILIFVLITTMMLTMFSPEKSRIFYKKESNWKPFIRLVIMTIFFTSIILLAGYFLGLAGKLLKNLSDISIPIFYTIMGYIVMIIIIGLGSWISIQIGLEKNFKERKSYSWWIINRLAFLVGSINIASFAIFFLQIRLGLDNETVAGPASRLIMVIGFFILILAVPSGRLSDKYSPKLLVAASGLIAFIGTVIIILAHNPTYLYLGGILIGIAIGSFYSSNWALGTKIIPEEESAKYLGISNLAGAGAGAIGAYIGGPIADQIASIFPHYPDIGYVVLFAIFGGLFLFSIATLIPIKVIRT